MCRLLAVRSRTPFSMVPHLEQFRRIALDSPQYQGHGWGCAWRDEGNWKIHKSVAPIWEADFSPFGRTDVLLAHVRSAFQDDAVRLDCNMPFFQEPYLFLFNGELRGVRIREEGASGAEKIFRYIRKVQDKGMYDALRRGSEIIQKKSLYVKAMNILIADPERFYIRTFYSEQEDYFALRWKADPDLVIVSSQEYPDDSRGWGIIPNGACIEV